MLRAFAALLLLSAAAHAQDVTAARYDEPTTRYDHGILGDAIEHGALVMTTEQGKQLRIRLPESRVFEDTEPRLYDVDNDGEREVIVVETDLVLGARLAIYGPEGLISATDYIGQTHRWLAPAGAADIDGDGRVEIAYVDRPHLARELVIVRFRPGKPEPVARFMAVTNHRIGDREIAGGIRTCAGAPEIVVADAAWQEVLAIRFDGTLFGVTRLGAMQGERSFTDAMACK